MNIPRPQRWDRPFASDMGEAAVDRLLAIPPFNQMDPERFPDSIPLRGILRNDSRIRRYYDGDIIIREGDYENSAYLILSGQVHAVIDAANPLPAAYLGRREPQPKSVFSAFAQWWENPETVEKRDLSLYQGLDVNKRGEGLETRIFLQDVPAILERHTTARLFAGQLEQGDVFGELAAMGRIPRTATIFAEGEVELLEIDWQGLRDIRRYDEAFREHIDTLYRKRGAEEALRSTWLFTHLAHASAPENCPCEKCVAMNKIVESTLLETYGSFEWHRSYKQMVEATAADRLEYEPIIAEEGDYINGLILIRTGFARLSKRFGHGHRTVSYIGRGHIYGFDEIANNWRSGNQAPLQHTLRAVGYVDVIVIPTAIIEEYVLGPDRNQPRLPRQFLPPPIKSTASDTQVSKRAQSGKAIGEDMLEFLVEQRFINGTQTMVIDLDRCTRCDDCVRACASTHENNPRFIRHGPKIGHHMVANACMHCVDPVCMIGCPTGAIHRDQLEGQVVINDATCIGCGMCANSCPYDNIRMVDIRDAHGNFILDEMTGTSIAKATKCDLCVDQPSGPACQSACPHDALIRIDLHNDSGLFADWLGR